MSLLDEYIYEERTNLSEVANSSSGDCYVPDACAADDIAKSSFKLEVCLSKYPVVRNYAGGIPIITNDGHITKVYHQYIEQILENNNMFSSYTSPQWKTEGPFVGLSFNFSTHDIEAIVSYGFEINPCLSARSVMRFVNQIFQIPMSGDTFIVISKTNSEIQLIVIHIADNYRGLMYYDSLKRMDLLKKLMRLFSDDKNKSDFHLLNKVVGRYRVYARPDGCVNYANICEEKLPYEKFEKRTTANNKVKMCAAV